ncbi:hypothetical protein [Phenylobacterium sp.]|uniref:hypothetical protein n=1 Tax=Phenylobacterium sp. TaxID=1871053 RepID=UPI0037C93068
MLFLMNDWVMQFETQTLVGDLMGINTREISFPQILVLGQELYAEDPQLHLRQPQLARRLAALTMTKQPEINALLFRPPHQGCHPRDVTVRYCAVGFDMLAQLLTLQEAQRSGGWANKEVWNKLGNRTQA